MPTDIQKKAQEFERQIQSQSGRISIENRDDLETQISAGDEETEREYVAMIGSQKSTIKTQEGSSKIATYDDALKFLRKSAEGREEWCFVLDTRKNGKTWNVYANRNSAPISADSNSGGWGTNPVVANIEEKSKTSVQVKLLLNEEDKEFFKYLIRNEWVKSGYNQDAKEREDMVSLRPIHSSPQDAQKLSPDIFSALRFVEKDSEEWDYFERSLNNHLYSLEDFTVDHELFDYGRIFREAKLAMGTLFGERLKIGQDFDRLVKNDERKHLEFATNLFVKRRYFQAIKREKEENPKNIQLKLGRIYQGAIVPAFLAIVKNNFAADELHLTLRDEIDLSKILQELIETQPILRRFPIQKIVIKQNGLSKKSDLQKIQYQLAQLGFVELQIIDGEKTQFPKLAKEKFRPQPLPEQRSVDENFAPEVLSREAKGHQRLTGFAKARLAVQQEMQERQQQQEEQRHKKLVDDEMRNSSYKKDYWIVKGSDISAVCYGGDYVKAQTSHLGSSPVDSLVGQHELDNYSIIDLNSDDAKSRWKEIISLQEQTKEISVNSADFDAAQLLLHYQEKGLFSGSLCLDNLPPGFFYIYDKEQKALHLKFNPNFSAPQHPLQPVFMAKVAGAAEPEFPERLNVWEGNLFYHLKEKSTNSNLEPQLLIDAFDYFLKQIKLLGIKTTNLPDPLKIECGTDDLRIACFRFLKILQHPLFEDKQKCFEAILLGEIDLKETGDYRRICKKGYYLEGDNLLFSPELPTDDNFAHKDKYEAVHYSGTPDLRSKKETIFLNNAGKINKFVLKEFFDWLKNKDNNYQRTLLDFISSNSYSNFLQCEYEIGELAKFLSALDLNSQASAQPSAPSPSLTWSLPVVTTDPITQPFKDLKASKDAEKQSKIASKYLTLDLPQAESAVIRNFYPDSPINIGSSEILLKFFIENRCVDFGYSKIVQDQIFAFAKKYFANPPYGFDKKFVEGLLGFANKMRDQNIPEYEEEFSHSLLVLNQVLDGENKTADEVFGLCQQFFQNKETNTRSSDLTIALATLYAKRMDSAACRVIEQLQLDLETCKIIYKNDHIFNNLNHLRLEDQSEFELFHRLIATLVKANQDQAQNFVFNFNFLRGDSKNLDQFIYNILDGDIEKISLVLKEINKPTYVERINDNISIYKAPQWSIYEKFIYRFIFDQSSNTKQFTPFIQKLLETDDEKLKALEELLDLPEITFAEILVQANLNIDQIKQFKAKKEADLASERKGKLSKQFEAAKAFLAEDMEILLRTKDLQNFASEIKDQFLKLNVFGRDYVGLSTEALVGKLQDLKENQDADVDAKIKILAILREIYFRTNGEFAYSTQMLPLIYLAQGDAKKVMAEISTGEGKTLITNLYAAYLALAQQKAVHLTSSTNALSKRDFEAAQKFYQSLGIKLHYIDHQFNEETELGSVSFSTPANLYFSISRDKLKGLRITLPKERVLVLDEADTAIDNQAAFCLSLSDGEEDFSKLYPIINQFYADNKTNITQFLAQEGRDEAADDLAQQLKWHLKSYHQNVYHQLMNFVGENSFLLDDKLKSLLASARYVDGLREGEDYILESSLVEMPINKYGITEQKNMMCARIINKNSEPDRVSSWADGVQQLLHSKLQGEGRGEFFISKESLSLTNGGIANLLEICDQALLVTGTAGNREEIELYKEEFGLDEVLKLPTHKTSKRKDLEPKFFDDQDAHLNYLKGILGLAGGSNSVSNEEKRAANQPVLIIAKNIAEAKNLKDKLGVEGDSQIQIITGEESEAELKKKIENAGKDGFITISTPFAGRGVDIKIQDQQKDGRNQKHPHGLYTITLDIFNSRTEAQIKGRSARGGGNGKTISLIDKSKYQAFADGVGSIVSESFGVAPLTSDADRLKAIINEKDQELIRAAKKQILEEKLYQKIFEEFCFYKQKIVEAKCQEFGESVRDSLNSSLEKAFGNFMDQSFFYYQSLEVQPENFKKHFETPFLQKWADFVDNHLFKGAAKTKAPQASAPRPKPVASIQERSAKTATDRFARRNKPAAEKNKIAVKKDAEVQFYEHQFLSPDGQYSLEEQYLLHIAYLQDSGYEINFGGPDAGEYKFSQNEQQLQSPLKKFVVATKNGETIILFKPLAQEQDFDLAALINEIKNFDDAKLQVIIPCGDEVKIYTKKDLVAPNPNQEFGNYCKKLTNSGLSNCQKAALFIRSKLRGRDKNIPESFDKTEVVDEFKQKVLASQNAALSRGLQYLLSSNSAQPQPEILESKNKDNADLEAQAAQAAQDKADLEAQAAQAAQDKAAQAALEANSAPQPVSTPQPFSPPAPPPVLTPQPAPPQPPIPSPSPANPSAQFAFEVVLVQEQIANWQSFVEQKTSGGKNLHQITFTYQTDESTGEKVPVQEKFSFFSKKAHPSQEDQSAVQQEAGLAIKASIKKIIDETSTKLAAISNSVLSSDESKFQDKSHLQKLRSTLQGITGETPQEILEKQKAILGFIIDLAKDAKNGLQTSPELKNCDDQLQKHMKYISRKWQMVNESLGLFTEYSDKKKPVGMRTKRIVKECLEKYQENDSEVQAYLHDVENQTKGK